MCCRNNCLRLVWLRSCRLVLLCGSRLRFVKVRLNWFWLRFSVRLNVFVLRRLSVIVCWLLSVMFRLGRWNRRCR